MKVRPWAAFDADFSKEELEIKGDLTVVGAKEVAEAIAATLRQLGCETEEVDFLGPSGWGFNAEIGRVSIWCQVTIIEKFLALIDDRTYSIDKFLDKIFRKYNQHDHVYQDLLSRVNAELSRHPKFHEVRWFAAEEVETDFEGAASPISDKE